MVLPQTDGDWYRGASQKWLQLVVEKGLWPESGQALESHFMEQPGAKEKAQKIKCLLCRNEDQRLGPQN